MLDEVNTAAVVPFIDLEKLVINGTVARLKGLP
jgi:hypothetical protein